MSSRTGRIALVLAGGSARPGTHPGDPIPKALLPVAGRPLVARTTEALWAAGCDPIFVLHDAGDAVESATQGTPGVRCIPRTGRHREYAAGIRFGLQSIASAVPGEALSNASIVAVACDQALADAPDFDALLSAFESSGLDVAMGLGDAASTSVHLPDRRLSVVRLHGSPDAVVQTIVTLRGGLLRDEPGGFRFADWSTGDMDRIENLLRSARERRGTPWQIPLLVYREVLRRIDSPASLFRLLRAVLLFALGRLDAATAVGVVTDLSGLRFGVLRNDRWRLCFDVDSAADLQFAEEWLARCARQARTSP